MKQAVIFGDRKAGLIDAPDPTPKEDWAVVKVELVPMCTEYKAFKDGGEARNLGHEAVGEVVAIDRPGLVEVGDRVVVQPQYPCGKCFLCLSGEYIHCQDTYDTAAFLGYGGGTATYAQYVVKPSWLLSPIPDEVSYEHAGLALCALGPTFNACQMTNVQAADTLLVTGLGPVGLGGVVNGLFRGARVIAVDMIEWRRNRALEMSAVAAFDPREDGLAERIVGMTTRRGVDVSIDTSGETAAHELCLKSTRRKGRFSLVQGFGESPLGLGHFVWSGHQLFGAWHYNLGDYWKLMEVILRSGLNDLLNSHTFGMSEVQKAFELQCTGECAKVMLKAWE